MGLSMAHLRYDCNLCELVRVTSSLSTTFESGLPPMHTSGCTAIFGALYVCKWLSSDMLVQYSVLSCGLGMLRLEIGNQVHR